MFLYCTTKILFFLLIGLQGIFSTRDVCLENDITKLLDKWISQIFTIDAERAIELFDTIKDYELKEFEHNISQNVNNFQSTFFFQNINFHVKEELESDEWEPPQIHWKFSEDQMYIFFKDFHFRIWGTLGTTKGDIFTDFNTYLGIENFTFTINGSSTNRDVSKISHDTSSSGHWHWLNDGILQDINWTNDFLTDDDKKELAREMTSTFPKMLHQNFKHNKEFSNSLNAIVQTYSKPRSEIISRNPDLLTNPQQYHYLIPQFPFFGFTLRRIVINGLSNLESFKVHKTSPIFTHNLLVRNVGGSMTLDYGSKDETPLELDFQIDSLFISKKEPRCALVQAKYYSITRDKANTKLTGRQSEVIMNGLESAIASSILPSMEVGRICDLETSLEQINITNESDWETVKKSYKGWIPFNDD